MKQVDVCIIGAGPGGASAAIQLSNLGVKSIVLEKARFPRDKVCGDALSGKVLNALRRLDPELEKELLASKKAIGSWGVTFVAPNGKALRVPFSKKDKDLNDPPGFICKRLHFDQMLFERLEKDPNIQVAQEVHLRSAKRENGSIILEPKGHEPVEAKMVIDASGANSWFSRNIAGLKNIAAHNCAGVRAYYSGVSGLDEHGFIELHFIKEALPGYFWIFPLPNGGANVGLGMRSDLISKRKMDLKQLMKDVVEKAPAIRDRFADANLEGPVKGFPLPLGSKRQKLSGDNYLLVGDAAHLIDPFTGEGISNAMISGAYAAEVCEKALKAQDFSADNLKEYDERVYKRLGQELSLSYKMQRLARQPRLFNLVVNKALKNETLSRTISSMFDDMDLREELRKPSFYYKILFG